MKPTRFVVLLAFLAATAFGLQGTAALNLTAKSANVTEPGTPVKINLLRWSTDEERKDFLASMDPNAPRPAAGRGGRGARGLDPDDPALADVGGTTARGGRGGRGGGGGRGGRGGDAPAAPPPDPAANLAVEIGKAPTLGYIWTNEVTGYAIKYAYHTALPDGGDRIILVADRRLGGYSPSWKLNAASTPTNYDFTVVEIHLDSKGVGEGKTSLTANVVVDSGTNTLAIENYGAAPAILQSVKK